MALPGAFSQRSILKGDVSWSLAPPHLYNDLKKHVSNMFPGA